MASQSPTDDMPGSSGGRPPDAPYGEDTHIEDKELSIIRASGLCGTEDDDVRNKILAYDPPSASTRRNNLFFNQVYRIIHRLGSASVTAAAGDEEYRKACQNLLWTMGQSITSRPLKGTKVLQSEDFDVWLKGDNEWPDGEFLVHIELMARPR